MPKIIQNPALLLDVLFIYLNFQLNFNLILSCRKYPEEVVLGWLVHGGMDDADVGGLITNVFSPTVGCCGSSGSLVPESSWWTVENGPWAGQIIRRLAVSAMEGRRYEPHSHVSWEWSSMPHVGLVYRSKTPSPPNLLTEEHYPQIGCEVIPCDKWPGYPWLL